VIGILDKGAISFRKSKQLKNHGYHRKKLFDFTVLINLHFLIAREQVGLNSTCSSRLFTFELLCKGKKGTIREKVESRFAKKVAYLENRLKGYRTILGGILRLPRK